MKSKDLIHVLNCEVCPLFDIVHLSSRVCELLFLKIRMNLKRWGLQMRVTFRRWRERIRLLRSVSGINVFCIKMVVKEKSVLHCFMRPMTSLFYTIITMYTSLQGHFKLPFPPVTVRRHVRRRARKKASLAKQFKIHKTQSVFLHGLLYNEEWSVMFTVL